MIVPKVPGGLFPTSMKRSRVCYSLLGPIWTWSFLGWFCSRQHVLFVKEFHPQWYEQWIHIRIHIFPFGSFLVRRRAQWWPKVATWDRSSSWLNGGPSTPSSPGNGKGWDGWELRVASYNIYCIYIIIYCIILYVYFIYVHIIIYYLYFS